MVVAVGRVVAMVTAMEARLEGGKIMSTRRRS
jgi:hypothetical protein